MTKVSPFGAEDKMGVIRKNSEAIIKFPFSLWKDISHEVKDLIKRMTAKNPKDRVTAEEALKHEWFAIPKDETIHPEVIMLTNELSTKPYEPTYRQSIEEAKSCNHRFVGHRELEFPCKTITPSPKKLEMHEANFKKESGSPLRKKVGEDFDLCDFRDEDIDEKASSTDVPPIATYGNIQSKRVPPTPGPTPSKLLQTLNNTECIFSRNTPTAYFPAKPHPFSGPETLLKGRRQNEDKSHKLDDIKTKTSSAESGKSEQRSKGKHVTINEVRTFLKDQI